MNTIQTNIIEFAGEKTVSVRALFIGEKLDLRTLENTKCLGDSPLTIAAGEHGCVILQRYGAVVLFGLDSLEEAAFIEKLQPWIAKPFKEPEFEEAQIKLNPNSKEIIADNGIIELKEFSVERLQIVADVLAKSVILSHYENAITMVFDKIEPIAASIKQFGNGRHDGEDLLKLIGNNIMVQQTTIGLVGIEEKPEQLWDYPNLERLYVRLEDEYEIRERDRALERKLELISRTAQTVLDLMQHRSAVRVEWYIVILIVVEVILNIYELFFMG
ncbi:RMD1 family protein [Myxosarcina sp. GI1]|uniref:RMD1 family protein n=1 Tax=Myxosarcina sp. GI1 TaxID=1541065 RepID=UPI0006899A4F|nr:RMD1 family protein [Myxosarcina sp. GI1]